MSEAIAMTQDPRSIETQADSQRLDSLQGVNAPEHQEDTRSALYNALARSPLGMKIVAGVLSANFATPVAASAVEANAAQSPVAPTITKTTVIDRYNRVVEVDEQAVANQQVKFGEDVRIKRDKKSEKRCMTTKGTWTNSVKLPNGKLQYYEEDVKAKLCRNKYSPTGWVKVGGGKTGKDCHNPAKPKPMPKPPKFQVINVRDLDNKFEMKAVLKKDIELICPGTVIRNQIDMSASTRMSYRNYNKMSGAGRTALRMKLDNNIKLSLKVKLNCYGENTSTTTTTTETQTPPPAPNKDSTQAPNTGTQPGAGGGSPESTTTPGGTCEDANGNVVSGTPDQFGNC